MNIPTAADFRADTRIDWGGRFGLPAPTPPDPDPLDAEIALAWVTLEEMTGRDFETMEAKWDPIILQATKYMTVYNAAAARGDFTALIANTTGIVSFTVPGYSETRQAAASLSNGRGYLFHPWEVLDRLIWLLATDEERDEMMSMAQGKHRPAAVFAAPDENPSMIGIERDLYW